MPEAASAVARLLVRLALPVAPLVFSVTAPVSRLVVVVSVIVAFEAEVANDDVPPTVSAPVCVRLPTASLTVRLPPTLDAASAVARLLVRLASALGPVVLSATAPVSRLALLSVIVAFEAEVVNADVPPTVSTPVCVRLPSVLTTVRLPPTLDAPRARPPARLLVRLAVPVAPVVFSVTGPVSRLAPVSVISALFTEVVNDDAPATVSTPVCVRLAPAEAVTVRLPPTFEAASTVARLLVRLASPVVPLVFSDTAPVSRLALVSVIVAFAAEVVNDDVPVTVSTPVCVRLPSVLTAVRPPPTLDVPRTKPPARLLVRLALPLAPLAVSDTAPVSRLASFSVIVAFAAEVVNDDVPPTVNTPVCVRFPIRSVTTRLPPMLEAASTVARLLVRLALPLGPLVLSDTAPVSRLVVVASVIVAFEVEVVNDDAPVTVSAPVCVKLPTEAVTVRLPPTVDAASAVARALVRLASPLAPLVFSVTAPVSRLALLSVGIRNGTR